MQAYYAIDPNTTVTVQAAQTGKAVRLRRVVLTPPGQLSFLAGGNVILPTLGSQGSSALPVDVAFNADEEMPQTAPGHALQVRNNDMISIAKVWIAWDVV